ncbi:MAG: ADP-ribosylglycohydrolase family protein [Bacteroidetes bacterium]|nr:ADP-ribosylglycohydrolase family protein [Bacteroidota bacterium]
MKTISLLFFTVLFTSQLMSCSRTQETTQTTSNAEIPVNPDFEYKNYTPKSTDRIISRENYLNQLYGFWLGESIANWTGLVTEMDKIGTIGEIKTGDFYTRTDWGKPDQPNIWSGTNPSHLSPTIDFVFAKDGEPWGSDDDTDIEYMYQYLLFTEKTSVLSGEQIKNGWLKHIKKEEENYLWVSNQKAFDLMTQGYAPPATSDPINNPEFEMIDAQLTTEIFGLFAPTRPDVALKLAHLPIQTTARKESEWISEFYVLMYSLASDGDQSLAMKNRIMIMADQARNRLPENSYPAGMYDFVKGRFLAGISWEQTRDEVYDRYQIQEKDGYNLTSRKLYCNGCFAAGINFASSLISLFYGEGDLKETIKIGSLCGWDSDNPTATWGGLLGFMIGKDGIEKVFDRTFSDRFNIHRTRINFPGDGIDSFENMAKTGVFVTDQVIQEEMGGGVDLKKNVWYIPASNGEIEPGK